MDNSKIYRRFRVVTHLPASDDHILYDATLDEVRQKMLEVFLRHGGKRDVYTMLNGSPFEAMFSEGHYYCGTIYKYPRADRVDHEG